MAEAHSTFIDCVITLAGWSGQSSALYSGALPRTPRTRCMATCQWRIDNGGRWESSQAGWNLRVLLLGGGVEEEKEMEGRGGKRKEKKKAEGKRREVNPFPSP